MCSVDSFEEGDSLMKEKENPLPLIEKCRKCESKASVVLQGKFPYCQKCFLQMVEHKFFATLGKSKQLKPGDKLLVAFSGSASSTALLNLISEGMHYRNKKIAAEVNVVFVDEGDLLGLDEPERIKVVEEITNTLAEYGFKNFLAISSAKGPELIPLRADTWRSPQVGSSLETEISSDSLNMEDWIDDVPVWEDSEVEKVDSGLKLEEIYEQRPETRLIISDIPSSTSHEDFLLRNRQNLIMKVATMLECDKVFTAETSNHMAVKILSDLAIGRGGQLPLDVGFCDNRDKIVILRPMIDWSRKEVAFYNFFKKLIPVIVPKIPLGSSGSIQQLTEKFVINLQDSFPSTVSTIVGTGSKLKLNSDGADNEDECIFCKVKLDSYNEESAVGASKISHLVSALGSKGFNAKKLIPINTDTDNESKNDSPKSEEGCSNCHCKNSPEEIVDLSPFLCYGCRLIWKDSYSTENWPEDVMVKGKQKIQLQKMNDEIKDFLIED